MSAEKKKSRLAFNQTCAQPGCCCCSLQHTLTSPHTPLDAQGWLNKGCSNTTDNKADQDSQQPARAHVTQLLIFLVLLMSTEHSSDSNPFTRFGKHAQLSRIFVFARTSI